MHAGVIDEASAHPPGWVTPLGFRQPCSGIGGWVDGAGVGDDMRHAGVMDGEEHGCVFVTDVDVEIPVEGLR